MARSAVCGWRARSGDGPTLMPLCGAAAACGRAGGVGAAACRAVHVGVRREKRTIKFKVLMREKYQL